MSIKRYLPELLQPIVQLAKICETEDVELKRLNKIVLDHYNEVVVDTSSEYGLGMYERLFNIVPGAEDTITLRKFRIQNIFLNKLPFTIRWLYRRLDEIVGAGNFTVDIEYNEYKLSIILSNLPLDMLGEVQKQFRHSIPSNMELLIGNEESAVIEIKYSIGMHLARRFAFPLDVNPEVDFSLLGDIATTYQSTALTNLISNGDFSDGTVGWSSFYGTGSIAIENENLVFTGINNSYAFTDVRTPILFNGDIYYMGGKVRTLDETSRIRFMVDDNSSRVDKNNPTLNEWYELSFLGTRSGGGSVVFRTSFSEPAGKKIEVEYVLAINLTQTFGAGNEPTKEEMDSLVQGFIPNLNDFKHAKEFATSVQSGVDYELHLGTYDEEDWYGVWLNTDYFVGYIKDGVLDIIVDFSANTFIIKSLKGSTVSNIRLIRKTY